MKNIYDTAMPDNWSKRLLDEINYDLGAEHMDKIISVNFLAIAEILQQTKSMNTPAAMIVDKLNGEFVAAGICEYYPNEDSSKPGNWSLVFTFDESDIPENALKVNLNNNHTHSFFSGVASKYGFRYLDSGSIITLTYVTFEEIKKYLDENAKEGVEVGIELPEIFQARVAVENGMKVFSLEPAGQVKAIVKSDAEIEK